MNRYVTSRKDTDDPMNTNVYGVYDSQNNRLVSGRMQHFQAEIIVQDYNDCFHGRYDMDSVVASFGEFRAIFNRFFSHVCIVNSDDEVQFRLTIEEAEIFSNGLIESVGMEEAKGFGNKIKRYNTA